ncbi:Bug family tripartite tricarboxylate transporter substrate binding protein [Falsirhodobacter halotolerans]|uniref:Bug family tripartite tricarboxylate transporter substrate binding protein n=1 Tax=Falsirhodobacter halotolerans TaxID=1146892 RepID=UPI001FD0A223|nr:tripartite tricarboxylate transporter substrate-binding protein [Falsirhodobacter halotolerans]MCJ8140931.1 tripartite tricarboxylate transporter substrate binding protein [Falsirhodobacter halotolerans]
MKFSRIAALGAVMSMCALPALAEIRRPECVAPAQPGGGFDLTCRVAQQGLEAQFSRPIEVTFMPGGIGAVAFNMFNTTRKADQDAIVAFSSGSLLNLLTGKYGPNWTEDDVRWLATAGADYGAVIVRADSKFQTLNDVMDALKANPGGVVVGAGGSVGSQDWMKAALLLRATGGEPQSMRYVAFDGGGDAVAGLLGGSIEVYTGDAGEMTSHLEAGDLRVLAVMADERLDAPFAEIPTAKELGYDVSWTILRGFYVGKDVADADYDQWVNAFKAAYDTPEFAETQKSHGLMPLNMAGDELTAFVHEQTEQLRAIATEAGLIQ